LYLFLLINFSGCDKARRESLRGLLVKGVLHVRFSYPKGAEMEVEPLGTKAQAFLFRDGETGGVTALEELVLA
jgi:hypothetical protein